MTIRIEVASLIRTLSKDGNLSVHSGEAEKVLEEIREECSEQGKNILEWAATIREHGRVPEEHPFIVLCKRLGLPEDHPMRTLGSWAFGFGNPWIVIHWIQVDNEPIISRSEFDPSPQARG